MCEFLAILIGDTDANKMSMGDAKLRNFKVILWPNLHDFSNNWPERGTGLISSFGRSGTPWIFHLHLI